MNNSILLTGANGFLGTQIARQLMRDSACTITAIVRAESREDALHRLSRAWWEYPGLIEALDSRISVKAGDVAELHLGLDDIEYTELTRNITHIVHAAADLRLDAPLDELRKTNVDGTAHMLELARKVHSNHGLTRFSFISSAYVAGAKKGIISEDFLTDEYGFYSNYEISKYEAESLVQKVKDELPVSIFRPGQIVGDSRTGAIKTFNTLYFPLRLYFSMRPIVIPAPLWLRINMVPVDYVADAVVRLTLLPDAAGKTFHLVAPYDKLPSVREFLGYIRNWAREQLNLKIPPPLFLPLSVPVNRVRYRARGIITRENKSTIDSLITLLPYFYERRRFIRDNTDRFLGDYDFRWKEVLPVLLKFAVDRGFMHRSERTVHEQILYRLNSRSMPVSYYDVVGEKTIAYDTKEVRKCMLKAANALRSMGIEKGDRVALVGPNCVRYLILDVAISMVGAVSVPLYTTSPSDEINRILKESGAKALFIGTSGIVERLTELSIDIPVVSFCRVESERTHRHFFSWDAFISLGDGSAWIFAGAQVGLGDLATIRYTSGTTGRIKGVCFTHQNLRWIAETVCTVMHSWRAGNKQVCYLSYLPMNHVVEGMLAVYSPYYTPAPFHIYFLEDMNDLSYALRMVRPNIFFSIPRFYEKVWEALTKGDLGRLYCNIPEGLRKNVVRAILSRALLKKAGLNRCAHLVVGSATTSEALLRNFKELGIEVHNAYGLTEAPLVTMNMLGANRVETVGEPLPQTEVRILGDGEIIVRGPQVAQCYWNNNEKDTFRDGWLYTGDLGYLTEEGSLVINGRKKDIIVTSYGKNMYPEKIESLLRSLPYVEEALVVGDGFPFCSALIWVPGDKYKPALIDYLEQLIKDINYKLSHPEQVKRWAILKNNLSAETGELTASLKLRRKEAIQRFSDVIKALYDTSSCVPDDNIHIDGIEHSRQ